ncbi:MAG: hypothetical protein KDB23_16525 [Planctomycetales bacterium]|nr:hypothetical protein [Planctomycetales bacterium]
MVSRRDLADARRMTPEVRQFATKDGPMSLINDSRSIRSAEIPDVDIVPMVQVEAAAESSVLDCPPMSRDVRGEWTQYSARLPRSLLDKFRRFSLQRELDGLSPFQQQDLLAEAVTDLLSKYTRATGLRNKTNPDRTD